jgi:transposase
VADNQGLLLVTPEQRDELESWGEITSVAGGRCIPSTADSGTGRRNELSGDRTQVGASAPTVSMWKSRFEQEGMEGLQGRHQGSKPRRATPAVQARVIRRAQQKPTDGSTHWSCRKLSGDLGISKSTVQRILVQAKLQLRRLDHYMASKDPEFETKAADIIGLYMNPPQHAAAFCVDEKTAIQALDRLDRCCPCRPDAPSSMGLNITATVRCRCT